MTPKTHHTTFPLVELPLVLVAARRARIDGATRTKTATTPARVQDLTTHQLRAYVAKCEQQRLTDHDAYEQARELLTQREEAQTAAGNVVEAYREAQEA